MLRDDVNDLVTDLADVFSNADLIDEGRALPIGTLRKWGDGNVYRKVSAGLWSRVDARKKAVAAVDAKQAPFSRAMPVEHPRGPSKREPSKKTGASAKEAETEAKYTEFDTPPEGRWIDKAPGLPEDTLVVHFDGNGKPKAYRVVEHERIISRALASAPAPDPGEQPHVILTMGVPASGKSTYRSKIVEAKYVIADADNAKRQLPEFQEAWRKKARNAAMIVHNESGYINDQIIDTALIHKKHLIIDGVGSNPDWYRAQMRELKSRGYLVSLVMTHLDDVEEAVRRGRERGERDGRFVVEDYQREMFSSLPKHFLRLLPEADHAAVYDTSGGRFRLAFEKLPKGVRTLRKGFMDRHFAEQAEAIIPLLRGMFSIVEEPRHTVDVSAVMHDLEVAAKDHREFLASLPKKFGKDEGFIWPSDDVTSEFYKPRNRKR